jgi:ribonuclease D
MAALKDALAGPPPPEFMVPPERRARGSEPAPAALDLLKTLLRMRATQYRVAPRLVASTDDLERLASGENDGGVPALHGWRAEIFGNDAVALREGRLAIALDNGEAVVIETGVEKKPRAKRGA